MSESTPNRFAKPGLNAKDSSRSEVRSLSYDDSYQCPICHHGDLSRLTLMDAFACEFCRHIFTADLDTQTIQVTDSSQPMSWRWTGRRWRATYQDDRNLSVALWIIGALLMILPPSLVWISVYLFPPLPGSPGAWFPWVWSSATLIIHSLIAAWLIAEYYQFSLYSMSKIWLQRYWNDWANPN